MIKKVTVTSARRNLDNLIDHVRHRHDSILIPRRGEPVEAIVDIGQFNKIRALESEFDRLAGDLQKAFEGRTIEKVEKDIRKRTRRGDLLTRLRTCHRRAKTIRKTVDCLVAAIAIENGLTLLHNDRDFDRIAECTELKIFQ